MSGAADAGRSSRRRWVVGVILFWLLGAAGVYFLHGWLLDEIVAQAARRGIALRDCRLDLGFSQVGLDGCGFEIKPDGRVFNAALANVAVGGNVEHVVVELSGFEPARLIVQGARATLRGEPNVRELLGARTSLSPSDLPIDVERSALSWQLEPDGPAVLSLSDLGFDARAKRLSSRFEVVRRGHGQLALGPEGLEVTLGDPGHPEVRLILRVLPKVERAELSLDLRRLPLRVLEGPWLQMTDTLRPIELEGRLFASVPLGLSMDVPSGDLHLTLHGLQFPIPRELEGLIYQSPPKLSGKFTTSRTFNRINMADLSFLAGELAMRGGADLEVEGQGLTIKARANGPLACRAIAESAATAHADSALARLAGSFAQRALTGSVEVLTAIEGHTSDLEHARVMTSIGVGCGLEPLPIDLGVSKELLERLPIDVLGALPRVDPGVLLPPRTRTNRSRGGLPGLLDLAPAPSKSP
ncbi:MAG TPA: hypothetical protein VMG12_19035 [Polyangiaceae bacterium]|nr:hypothetical protein [Polyangiaceae bacterium]